MLLLLIRTRIGQQLVSHLELRAAGAFLDGFDNCLLLDEDPKKLEIATSRPILFSHSERNLKLVLGDGKQESIITTID